jgi:CRISPR-associated protein Cmr3
MTAYYFVEPADSLFVRGNLDFGGSGEHGVSSLPPPPSLLAGAFRSAMLGRDGGHLATFLRGGATGHDELDAALGWFERDADSEPWRQHPGNFRIAWLSLAGAVDGAVEALLPLPADVVRLRSGFAPLIPGETPGLVQSNSPLPLTPMLRSAKQEKPESGQYLREAGIRKHQRSELPALDDALAAGDLCSRDPRLGIGLNAGSGTAESGLIYTTEGFAFSPPAKSEQEPRPFHATGFLVGVAGADGLLPNSGMLRLGGDGRAAAYRRVEFAPPRIDSAVIARTGRFRLVLLTAGLFPAGWLPSQCQEDSGVFRLQGEGFRARLAAAAVPRREVISGWDLFNWKPKDAERTAPAGSVYWFDEFEGDPAKLAAWMDAGLCGDNPGRRAEGYGLASLGLWN